MKRIGEAKDRPEPFDSKLETIESARRASRDTRPEPLSLSEAQPVSGLGPLRRPPLQDVDVVGEAVEERTGQRRHSAGPTTRQSRAEEALERLSQSHYL